MYIISLVCFLVIDGVWLFLAQGFYSTELAGILAEQINISAAIAFYLLYVFGLVYFVIAPNSMFPITFEVVFKGALFTFVAYATYDLTNLATIEGWPYIVSLVDMVWAIILGSLVTLASLYTIQKLRY